MLCKNTERLSQKIVARCFVKLLKYVLQKHKKIFWKHAVTFSANPLRNVLEKYWKVFSTYTSTSSEKILRNGLSKFWKVFCKIVAGSSTKNKQLACKNVGTSSASSYIIFFTLVGQEIIISYKKRSHLQIFDTYTRIRWYRR